MATIRELIKQRTDLDIKYKNRSDGGVLITSINGVKYKGARGNQALRHLTGSTLSSNRSAQLKYASGRRVKLSSGKIQKVKINVPKEMKNYLNRIQKLERKRRAEGIETGRTPLHRVKQSIAESGENITWEYLRHKYNYVKDIVNYENIRAVVERVNQFSRQYEAIRGDEESSEIADALTTLQDELASMADMEISNHNFKSVIENVYEVLKRVESGGSMNEVLDLIQGVTNIIHDR